MNKKIILLVIVGMILFLASVFYLWSDHYYDITKPEDIITDKNYIFVTYDKQEELLNKDVLGILTIEKIGLKATVKEGSTKEILKEYIGHIEETSKYDGNIGLAAHNRFNKYSYFARINELEKGDILIYKTKYYTRRYKVDKIAVIYETDWSYLENTEENKLTLITCIANKEEQRLCVQATEIIENK